MISFRNFALRRGERLLLSKVDINTMSPVEALLKLNEVMGVIKKS